MKNIFTGILVLAILFLGSINNGEAQIITQPEDTTICEGSSASFELEAIGGSSFQWQSSIDESIWLDLSDNNVVSGADS